MENELNDYYQKLYDVLTDEEVWRDMKDWWLVNNQCDKLYMLLYVLQTSISAKEFLKEYHQAKVNEYITLLNLKENENEKVSDN